MNHTMDHAWRYRSGLQIARFACCTIAFLTVLLSVAHGQPKPAFDAQTLLEEIDRAQRYASISYEGTMEIVQGNRILIKQFTARARGSNLVFLEFTNPEDRGVRMLRIEQTIWMYFPSEGETVRISGSMMRQGLMGSNLSYEEVAEGGSLRESYAPAVLGEETVDGRRCILLSLTSNRKDISFPIRKLWVDAERKVPLKIELYARSGSLMKTIMVRTLESIDGRILPTRIEILDALKKNSRTVFSMRSVKLDIALPDSLFTMEALTR